MHLFSSDFVYDMTDGEDQPMSEPAEIPDDAERRAETDAQQPQRYAAHHYAYSADLFDLQPNPDSTLKMPKATIYDHDLAEQICAALNDRQEVARLRAALETCQDLLRDTLPYCGCCNSVHLTHMQIVAATAACYDALSGRGGA